MVPPSTHSVLYKSVSYYVSAVHFLAKRNMLILIFLKRVNCILFLARNLRSMYTIEVELETETVQMVR